MLLTDRNFNTSFYDPAGGGAVGAAAFKHPGTPLQKIGIAAAAAAATSGAVTASIKTVGAVLNNSLAKDKVQNTLNQDSLPSPTDNTFISSLLEKGELQSPLQELLNIQIEIQIYLIIVIFLLFALIFNKFFANYSMFKLITKYSNKDSKVNKVVTGFVDKYFKIMFIFLSLLGIYLVFLNLIITCEITYRLDDYILVHNDIFKDSLLVLSLKICRNNTRDFSNSYHSGKGKTI